jgi:hypothetical protein
MLLSSTFVFGVRTPERLVHQLDVCAALVREVPMFWLRIQPEGGSARLAEVVDEHLRGVLGAAARR